MKINLKKLDVPATSLSNDECAASGAFPGRQSPPANAALAQLKALSGDERESPRQSDKSHLKRALEGHEGQSEQVPVKRQRRPDLPSPKSHSAWLAAPVVPAPRPAPGSYKRSVSFMDAAGRSPKPRLPGDPSKPISPDQLLKEARKHRRQGSSDQMIAATLSPSLVARLNGVPIKTTLASAIAAMKPGVAATTAGFRQVKLAGSPRSLRVTEPLKAPLGAGKFGTAYAVTLAENLVRNGKNLGREFVFKALLRVDPHNPLPVDLYAGLAGDQVNDAAARETVIREKKRQIVHEFQITSALTETAHVMQVYDLIQIGDEFGILCEKINGDNIKDLAGKSKAALDAFVLTEQDYLDVAKQAIADVLIAIAICADEGVAHSDISPGNVMYDAEEKVFKLIDMGNGREIGQPRPPGTPGYIDISTSLADPKSDIYGAGQLLAYFMKSAATPTGVRGFAADSLTSDDFPFMEALMDVSLTEKHNILDIIRRMIQVPPERRPSAVELLRDPFFANLAPRNQTHASYEKSGRWHRSSLISTRFTACYPDIEDQQARADVYQLALTLNRMWQEDADHDRQEEIEECLRRLSEPSIGKMLALAEERQPRSPLR